MSKENNLKVGDMFKHRDNPHDVVEITKVGELGLDVYCYITKRRWRYEFEQFNHSIDSLNYKKISILEKTLWK